jgi:glycosyltransferase involved in cell wall biosynthesis
MSPRVSIIVPNYNHRAFLERRIHSIECQTYTNSEIILLDDASSDGSQDLLRAFAHRNPGRVRLICNDSNSGSAFRQWARGIILSTGDYIWIAESDDYCDSHFLEKMVAVTVETDATLSYTAPVFVDAAGTPIEFQFPAYVAGIDANRWSKAYSSKASEEVQIGLGLRNTIVNVSACIFQRTAAQSMLQEMVWQNMKMCGDWCFYLNLIKDKSVSFLPNAGAFFTHTKQNTSAKLAKSSQYLDEHREIVRLLKKLYPELSHEFIDRNFRFMEDHWNSVFECNLPSFVLDERSVRLRTRLEVDSELSKARKNCESQKILIENLENNVAKARKNCESQKILIENLENNVAALNLKIRDAESSLNAILASRSWKLTHPFRWISTQLIKKI